MDWLVLYFVWWAASRVWAILGLVWLDRKELLEGKPDTSLKFEELTWIALPFFLEAGVLIVAALLAVVAALYGVLYVTVKLYERAINYIANKSITKR